MTVTLRPPVRCPACHATLDAHGEPPGRTLGAPAPGDYTVCLYCATVLVFGEPPTLRPLTAAELAALPADDEIRRVRAWVVRQIATGQN